MSSNADVVLKERAFQLYCALINSDLDQFALTDRDSTDLGTCERAPTAPTFEYLTALSYQAAAAFESYQPDPVERLEDCLAAQPRR